MLAPLAASLSRYGACPLPITLVVLVLEDYDNDVVEWRHRCSCFFFGADRRTVDFCSFGENGRSTALNFGAGRTTAVVSFGFGCATVGRLLACTVERLLDCRGGPADG